MATEWIDIVDTAVKIGLGGLISGVATYYVTQLKHKNEDSTSRKQVFRELMLEAVKYADEYFDYIYGYYSVLGGFKNAANKKNLSDDDWKEIYSILEEREGNLEQIRSSIYAAHSRFQLLGLKEPPELLSTFHKGESELREVIKKRDKVLPDEQFFTDWESKYVPIKEQFYKSTSNVFLSKC